jgi:hypothetical protein
MKELNFRAWDARNKKMLYDGFFLVPTKPTWSAFIDRASEGLNRVIRQQMEVEGDTMACNDYGVIDASDYYGIDNLKVMMSTGYKDADDRLIYEGDILVYSDTEGYGFETVKVGDIGVVYWSEEEAKFFISALNGHEDLSDWMTSETVAPNTTIIGNEHENPEKLAGLEF